MSNWTKTHELKVATGTYTDREGKEKKRYETIGHVLSDGAREMYMLKRTFNPAGMPDDGKDTILISKFEHTPGDGKVAPITGQKTSMAQSVSSKGDEFNDDIPF